MRPPANDFEDDIAYFRVRRALYSAAENARLSPFSLVPPDGWEHRLVKFLLGSFGFGLMAFVATLTIMVGITAWAAAFG
jgi:hypothetical protein